jgi:hypothetical protein
MERDGGLHIPLPLAACGDVLLGAAELSFGPLAMRITVWNVAAMSMVSVPGMELASWRWQGLHTQAANQTKQIVSLYI